MEDDTRAEDCGPISNALAAWWKADRGLRHTGLLTSWQGCREELSEV